MNVTKTYEDTRTYKYKRLRLETGKHIKAKANIRPCPVLASCGRRVYYIRN